ncbi:MAG: hypothetical protein WCJ07_07780, partial [Verrucomicrobiota bacterium]
LWDLWRGHFPDLARVIKKYNENEALLPIVHGGSLFIGGILIFMASPQPEYIRVESMRLGFKNFGAIFSRSAASLTIALAAAAAAAWLPQFMVAPANSWNIFLVATANLAEVFLIFALLLEFCRLRHQRRALGFVALWLFVLCVIPFILAGVFSNEAIARISLLSPGFIALTDRNDPGWLLLSYTLLAHFGVIVVLLIGWQRQWKKLLEHTA